MTAVKRNSLLLLAVCLLALAPTGLPPYAMTLLTEALILGLFAMSLDLMVGYTRLLSFGHAAAYGLGAYAVGNLLLHLEGNVRQWIIGAVGGAADVRNRAHEFAAREGSSRDDLLRHLEATLDGTFEVEAGLPLLVETARLWRSLGQHDAYGQFRIDGVTGPDEYSAIADNNVYTNLLAARNLRAAADAAERQSSRASELGVDTEEMASWREAAVGSGSSRRIDAIASSSTMPVRPSEQIRSRSPPSTWTG